MNCLLPHTRTLLSAPPQQVNADVLSWLLRPVPFVAGLPVPAPPRPPIPPVTSEYDSDQDTTIDTSRHVGKDREDDSSNGIDVVADGDVSDAGGGKEGLARTRQHQAGRVAPGGDATGEYFSAGSAGSSGSAGAAAAEERRAIPVPIFQGVGGGDAGGGGGGGGGEGKAGSKTRKGFHSYDETHQARKQARGRGQALKYPGDFVLLQAVFVVSCCQSMLLLVYPYVC